MHKLLDVVLPCLVETVRSERERHVVMSVLEAMNGVVKACQGEALQQPGRLQDISHAIRDVLKKKVGEWMLSALGVSGSFVSHFRVGTCGLFFFFYNKLVTSY